MKPFSVKHAKVSDTAFMMELHGHLTKEAEQPLTGSMNWVQAPDHNQRALIINFKHVPSISSTGITLLMRMVQRGIDGGYQIFGYGVSEHYQKLFRLLGITKFMMIYPDQYSILQRLNEMNGNAGGLESNG